MQVKTIITYGTFDLFHVGHLRLLRQLKSLSGDGKLIVAVSSDEFNLQKNKNAIIPFEQRAELVAAIDCVDQVIREDNWDQKEEDIVKYEVDIFAIGEDWAGKFNGLSNLCKVVYVPRTEGISTSELKHTLEKMISLEAKDVVKTYEILKQLSKGLS